MLTPPPNGRDAKATNPAARTRLPLSFIAGRRPDIAERRPDAGRMTPQTGALVVLFFGVLLPLAITAYFWETFSITVGFCPPTTFLSQPNGPTGLFVGGLMLGMACFFLLAGYFITVLAGTAAPDDPPEPPAFARLRARRGFHLFGLIAPLCGLCISFMLWQNFVSSFYCAMPDKVLFHPSSSGPWRSLRWDDVTTVQASCHRYRERYHHDYTLSATVRVSFADGEQIVSGWSTGEFFRTLSYNSIRAALAHKTYRYTTNHVSPELCPPDVYPLLLNWQD